MEDGDFSECLLETGLTSRHKTSFGSLARVGNIKMKNIILFFLAIGFVTFVSAQKNDSSIEVHLQIIKQVVNPNGETLKGFALSVSLINHSDSDFYIPNFSSISVHYYKNKSSIWRKIDVDGNEYDTVPSSKGGRHPSTSGYSHNKISNYYMSYEDSIYKIERSIFDNYLGIKLRFPGNHLFLRAKQEIDNYWVLPIDFLFTKKGEYRITFNNEEEDRAMFDVKKSVLFLPILNQILDYHIYMPDKLVSNVIYFSTSDSVEHF